MAHGLPPTTGRLRGFFIALVDLLSADEAAEVEEFIEHPEFGEALRERWANFEER